MAYTARDFVRDLVILNTGAALGFKRAAQMQTFAAKKGIAFAGRSLFRAGQLAATHGGGAIARGAAANPVAAGALLGAGYLHTEHGQDLLQRAADRGAADRIALEQAIDERIFAATRSVEDPQFRAAQIQRTTTRVKRKATKYSKAVKAGMAAVKKSKFIGSPGRINNAKKAFGTVNKVVSKVNKGLKPAKKGVSGVISRAVKGILK